jgi:hypothetical protein
MTDMSCNRVHRRKPGDAPSVLVFPGEKAPAAAQRAAIIRVVFSKGLTFVSLGAHFPGSAHPEIGRVAAKNGARTPNYRGLTPGGLFAWRQASEAA